MLDFFENYDIIVIVRYKGGKNMQKEREISKECVLYERECINCMECMVCDLDPAKICDNCGKCIEVQDVASIKIDKIFTNPEDYKE